MPDVEQRRVPELFWFVDERGVPMVSDAGTGGRNLFVFPFFTARSNAQRHRDQSTMEAGWQLTSSDSADELIGLCERWSGNYDAFVFDPKATTGGMLQPATLERTKTIIEDHAGAERWDLRQYY